MVTELKGLVLRSTDINESDRLITVYTDKMGLVTALAKGARSLKSRKMSSTMQFCYTELVLFSRQDKLVIKEASLIESFFDLRQSIDGLALAAYVTEMLENVATAEADGELLSLALNTLYAISRGKYDFNLIKAAFEMRAATILGFMPDVIFCDNCGAREGSFYFDIMAAKLQCAKCHNESVNSGDYLTDEHESHIVCLLTTGAKIAIEYCIYCPPDKLFSFNVSGEDKNLFCQACERYLLNHLGRGFKTLDFYNEVKR